VWSSCDFTQIRALSLAIPWSQLQVGCSRYVGCSRQYKTTISCNPPISAATHLYPFLYLTFSLPLPLSPSLPRPPSRSPSRSIIFSSIILFSAATSHFSVKEKLYSIMKILTLISGIVLVTTTLLSKLSPAEAHMAMVYPPGQAGRWVGAKNMDKNVHAWLGYKTKKNVSCGMFTIP